MYVLDISTLSDDNETDLDVLHELIKFNSKYIGFIYDKKYTFHWLEAK